MHRVRLGDDALELRLEIWAEDEPFPASCGWHPWWRRRLGRGEPLQLDLEAGAIWVRDEDGIPSGDLEPPPPGPWDDCFGMPDGVDVTLTWPEQLELKVKSRAEWVVVYDEQAEAVCVEPQSGPPNGLNTAPRYVTPIEPLEIATTWSWRRL